MSPLLEPIHRLAREVRLHGPALLADMPEPHDELMSLVWGPRFDREHALGLIARQPALAVPALPALLAAADAYDALHVPAQQRLRQLIRRHRALSAAATEGGLLTGDAASPPTTQPARQRQPLDWGMAEDGTQPWSIALRGPDGARAAACSLPM